MENLSIVIPVHNESGNVLTLAAEIERTFTHTDFLWEVIWVDDVSDDSTRDEITDFAKNYPHHRLIALKKRSGQSAAVLTGIQRAQYPLIGTLDGDGQNCPEDLIQLKHFLEKNQIYLAQGVRVKRKDSGTRIFSTGIANLVRNIATGTQLNDVGCAVRVFRKDALIGLPSFKGWHRFLPVMISLLYPGMIIEYPVSHRPRKLGVTKYGINNRLWVGLFDLIGMAWFKRRAAHVTRYEEVQWKNSSMESESQVNSFSPAGSLFNGLPVSGQEIQ